MTLKKALTALIAVFLLFCLLTGAVCASSTAVDTAVDKGLDYLAAHQNTEDAGFIEMNTDVSTISPTWFAVNAIVAAGEDPLSGRWVQGNKTVLDYLVESDSRSDGTGEIGKWITYVVACGEDPHTYAGYDAVAALKSKIGPDGRGGQYVYTTYWTIFGLVAAGEDASAPVKWLMEQQQEDGGFGSYGNEYTEPTDADNTAASIMAMIAAGVPVTDSHVQKAIQFLRDVQEDTGGYNYGYYSTSNLASTVWVIQAFCAVGIDPSTVVNSAGKSPVDYVLSLQKEDGSFKYTEALTDSPTGMTGRAVAALAGNPYPILPGETGFNIGGGTVLEKEDVTPIATKTPDDLTDDWEPMTVTDDYGYEVTINTRPQRIISLAPTNTEILFAVGAGDRVVAVTEYCDYPEEATNLPIIGGYSTVNIERVVTLEPDLIFAYYGNGLETVDYLKNLGYNVITLNSDSINGSINDIRLVGKAVGNESEAEAVIADMEDRMAAVTEKLTGISEEDEPSMVHCVWTDPLWVSGSSTFEDEMIEYAGGTNAMDFVDGWGIVTIEKFMTLDPDIIIVDSGMGMGEEGTYALKKFFYDDPRLSTLTAVKTGNIYIMNADLIDRGGPRIPETIEQLAQIAHPEIFGEYTQYSSTVASPGFSPVVVLVGLLGAVFVLRRIQ